MENVVELLENEQSVTGYELEQIINRDMSSNDEEVQRVAEILFNTYYAKGCEASYKPLKFVYYQIIKRNEDEYNVRRDVYLSPRAKQYFDVAIKTPQDAFRELIVNKTSVLGSDLKKMVAAMADEQMQYPDTKVQQDVIQQMSFRNLSLQLAEYVGTYFIQTDTPIGDGIWYKVTSKEYGTATVYRDLEKSPRK